MLVPHSMSGRKVGILGLGLSGMAAARGLAAAGAKCWLHDDGRAAPDDLPANAIPAHWQDWPWDGLDTMVISPGIPHDHPAPHPAAARALAADVEIISEIELAMRAAPKARLVAITGTNGKSTTTALIGHCLRTAGIAVSVGGNIGDAACNLDDAGPDGVIVLELSSYQLETTPSLHADVALLLNVTPDHLDRHGGMDGYVAAKARILSALPPHGLAIFGEGNGPVGQLAADFLARGGTAVTVSADDLPTDGNLSPALAGPHNAINAAAAAACLRHLGVSEADIAAGMGDFAGLPHRMQHVAQHEGVAFINDSKATNGVAAACALAAYDSIYWIAGGEAKEDGLGPAASATANVRRAYLIGSSAADFASTLDGKVPIRLSGDLESATTAAFADASAAIGAAGTATILLSPAAASFDQFDSFGDRGDAFCAIARRLATATATGGAHA
ncbi:MAG: UDP-N-acetylmuramoyl-L-alanine--D-glutamate ligase [SAR116 cluster bacterium]|nr:MAG: UDP-N-acetylmuramoyl-L-alanine--D-glutamate ligase [SAR116 cluster bacterium]